MTLQFYSKIDELESDEIKSNIAPRKVTDNEKSAFEAQVFPRIVNWLDEYGNYDLVWAMRAQTLPDEIEPEDGE